MDKSFQAPRFGQMMVGLVEVPLQAGHARPGCERHPCFERRPASAVVLKNEALGAPLPGYRDMSVAGT